MAIIIYDCPAVKALVIQTVWVAHQSAAMDGATTPTGYLLFLHRPLIDLEAGRDRADQCIVGMLTAALTSWASSCRQRAVMVLIWV